MPRMYTCPIDNVDLAAAQDLWECTPADDKPIAIIAIELGNVGGTADAADAQEEILRLTVHRGFTTSGSGGGTVTPVPTGSSGDTASGFTVETNNTTLATTSGVLVASWSWNTRVEFTKWLPQEAWIWASQANTTLLVRSPSTPADTFKFSGTLWVLEAP